MHNRNNYAESRAYLDAAAFSGYADTSIQARLFPFPYSKGRRRGAMAAKKQSAPPVEIFPLLKTVEQMSKISGIGEHKLREMMDTGEIEYVQNGNRRLLCENAIWDWYNRKKVPARVAREA